MNPQYQFSNVQPIDKTELLQSLERSGVLDITKAYLRSNLLETLKSKSTNFSQTQGSLSQSLQKGNNTLSSNPLLKLGVSLVHDFLSKLKLEYTLSTFQSEIKNIFGTPCPFSESEMLGFLNLNLKDFDLYKNETMYIFILHLLREKSKLMKEESQSQTEINLLNNPISFMPKAEKQQFISLEEQLKNIDEKYNSKLSLESLLPSKYSEEKFIKYKTEMEQRYKSDYENQIKRFKEIELSQMRIEENKKYLSKIENLRDEYEKEYKEKYEKLKQKEEESNKRILEKEKEIETIKFDNRQKFQEELNLLKAKEEEMNKKVDNEMSKLKLEQDKLKFKEREAEYIKENSLKKINDQVEQFKLDYEKKFFSEKMEFETEKMNFQTQNSSQIALIEKCKDKEKECNELKEELSNLKKELKNIRASYENSMKDNENLRTQINNLNLQIKRVADQLSKKDLEKVNLKEEVKLLKETLENQKNIFTSRKTNQQEIINELNQRIMELSMNKSAMLNTSNVMNTVPNVNYVNTNSNTDLEKKVKQMESTINQYKEMYNKLVNEKRGQNKPLSAQQKQIRQNFQLPSSFNINQNITLGKRLMNCPDRRETLAKLEEEQLKLNSQIRNEFRNITKKEVPVMVVSEEEIKQIKKNNYFNTVIVNEEREKFINIQNKKLEQKLKQEPNELNIVYNDNIDNLYKIGQPNEAKAYIVPSSQQPIPSQFNENTNINRSGSYNQNKPLINTEIDKKDDSVSHIKKKSDQEIVNQNDKKEVPLSSNNNQPLPTPIIVSDFKKQTSLRENNNTDNEISVENITNDSKEWNINSGGSKRQDNNKPKTEKEKDWNINQNLSIKKNNNSITGSIKEEIEDSKSKSISNHIKDNNDNSIRNDNSLSNKNQNQSESSQQNKFQNINYEGKDNNNNDDEIEEYGDDFVEDIEGFDKNKQSLDLDAYKNVSYGQSMKGKNMNVSVSSIHNKSGTTSNIEKFLQSKQSNIEENIEEELSYDNNSKKISTSNKQINNESSNSSQQYNDFVSSNVLKKDNLGASSNGLGGSDEIKEEILQSEDDDGYSPY